MLSSFQVCLPFYCRAGCDSCRVGCVILTRSGRAAVETAASERWPISSLVRVSVFAGVPISPGVPGTTSIPPAPFGRLRGRFGGRLRSRPLRRVALLVVVAAVRFAPCAAAGGIALHFELHFAHILAEMDVLQRLVGIEAHAEVPAVALQYLGVDVRVYLFGLGVPEQLLRVDLGAADDGRVALSCG